MIAPAGSEAPRRIPLGVPVAALACASALAALAGNGAPALAVAPLALSIVVVAAWRLPLRDTLPVLAFLSLTLENPAEIFASGQWRSPLATLGALFLAHMNVTLPVKALIFSGLDLALVLLVAAHLFRRATRGAEDAPGHVPAARPMRDAALVCLVTIAVVWAFGLARGGNFGNSLWQIFRVVYLPIVLLLFLAGLRGPADAGRLAKVLVVAALLRAGIAIHVRALFPDSEAVPFTTIHADSMLFADAFLLVVVLLVERPGRRTLLLALATLPVLVLGMIANNRRLVWVEVGASVLAVAVLTRWSPLKRRLAQAVVLSLPLLLVYAGVGWSNPVGPFAPVRVLRSVVDSKADLSTAWRDLENYNLFVTLKHDPLLGTGFGHEYEEAVRLPDISSGYALYRYAPHNSVLGLVAYAGVVGFAGIWMVIPIGVFLAVRSYRLATLPRDRVASLTSVGVLISYMVHCYGDMGLGTWVSVFTVAPALALVAKIAVATGAWPAHGAVPGAAASRAG